MRFSILALAACPAPMMAEGARMTLSCEVQTVCTQDGACKAAQDGREITVTPNNIDASGLGTYGVVIDGKGNEARGLSRTGPFLWQIGSYQIQTLTLTGETTALMIRQDTTPNGVVAPNAAVDFLTCEVTF